MASCPERPSALFSSLHDLALLGCSIVFCSRIGKELPGQEYRTRPVASRNKDVRIYKLRDALELYTSRSVVDCLLSEDLLRLLSIRD